MGKQIESEQQNSTYFYCLKILLKSYSLITLFIKFTHQKYNYLKMHKLINNEKKIYNFYNTSLLN